jgi:beta-lactamase regulating signal transducer with metallopeptidase domain
MEAVLRWLLTYLLHSTVLLGLAALARLALGERRLALQEALLRAALVGGLVTAGLQVGLDLHPLAGRLALPASLAAPGAPATSSAGAAGTAAAGARPTIAVAPAPVREDGGAGLAVEAPPARVVSMAPVPILPAWLVGAVGEAGGTLPGGLALAWAALAAVALARLGVAAVRLRQLLQGRRPIDAGALGTLAARMGRALGLHRRVPLSAAERLSVPLATGVLRPEVCLPERAVAELGTDEQAALCAHELAHVARRDPAWVLLARLVEALAPVQPLNGWARRRLQDLAECLSDDLAVAASGRPLGLARSLVDVASWTLGDLSILPGAAVGAVSARSRLGHRVERLMDPARRLERPRRLLLPAAAACVLATALVTPVVSGSVTADEPQPIVGQEDPPAPPPPAPAAVPAPPAPPEAVPLPAPEPPAAPKARPAPAPHAAPAPHPAPKVEVPSAEAQQRLEQLGRQIAERARLHEGEMKKLEAEIEAIAAKMQPDSAEVERLSAEISKAAQKLAESASADVAREGAKAGRKSEQTAEAARRMAELEKQLRETTRAARLPAEEIRALAEKARALAEQARPTAEELAEIRRLARDQARVAAEQARLTSDEIREAMRTAREALEHARDEMRRSREEQRPHPRDERDRQKDDPGEPPRD